MSCVISVLMNLATVPLHFQALLWMKLSLIDKGKHEAICRRCIFMNILPLGSPSWELSSCSFLANISKAILPYFFCGCENVSPFFFLLVSVCDHLFSGQDSSLSQEISWHSLDLLGEKKNPDVNTPPELINCLTKQQVHFSVVHLALITGILI